MSDDNAWSTFGKLVFGVLLFPIKVVLHAIVIRSYWDWFLTPITDRPTPPFWICLGLAIFVKIVIQSRSEYRDDPEKQHLKLTPIESTLLTVLFWTLAYGVGWAIAWTGPQLGY